MEKKKTCFAILCLLLTCLLLTISIQGNVGQKAKNANMKRIANEKKVDTKSYDPINLLGDP